MRVEPPHRVFKGVEEAGGLLAEAVAALNLGEAVVLSVGAEGAIAAQVMAARLGAKVGAIAVAHLALPWRTQLPFGALTEDDHHYLDPDVVSDHALSAREIAQIARELLPSLRPGTVKSRAARPDLTGRIAILSCGWLSTGYRARAAVASAVAAGARDVVVAAPCAARDAFLRVQAAPAKVVVLDVYDGPRFDPAEWFPPLPDRQVS